MSKIVEVITGIHREPVTSRERSLAFVSIAKEIYNHPRIRTLQGEAEGSEKWCELKDINWIKFKNLLPEFELPHLTSLKVGCEFSSMSQSAILKLQLEFKELKDTLPSKYLPIPARVIHELKVDNAGEYSTSVKIWYYQINSENPHFKAKSTGRMDNDNPLLLARFIKKALDGKFGGDILSVNSTQ